MPISIGLIYTTLKAGIEELMLFQGGSIDCWRGGVVEIRKSERFLMFQTGWCSPSLKDTSEWFFLLKSPHSHFSYVGNSSHSILSFKRYLLMNPSRPFSLISQLSFKWVFSQECTLGSSFSNLHCSHTEPTEGQSSFWGHRHGQPGSEGPVFSWSALSLWALPALQRGAAVPSSEQPAWCAASRTQQAQPPCAQKPGHLYPADFRLGNPHGNRERTIYSAWRSL